MDEKQHAPPQKVRPGSQAMERPMHSPVPQTAFGGVPVLKFSAIGVINDSNPPEKHVWRMRSRRVISI
jgi:hypothetical protein